MLSLSSRAGSRLEDRTTNHLLRLLNSQLRQVRGRHVGQTGGRQTNLLIAQKHPRHESVIHAMVAAPSFGIVFQDRRWYSAEHGSSTRSVATIVSNHEGRGLLHVRSPVD